MSELMLSAPDVELSSESGKVGVPVTISGHGFLANEVVTISVLHSGGASFGVELVTTDAGDFSSLGAAVAASGTLVSTGVNVTEDDTVTIGERVYTFKTTVDTETPPADLIGIGEFAADSLANLKLAINEGQSPITVEDEFTEGGEEYPPISFGTVAHEQVIVRDMSVSQLVLQSRIAGVGGNTFITETTAAELEFLAATLEGGTDATERTFFSFSPSSPGVWIVTVSDGVNEVETQLRVSQGV